MRSAYPVVLVLLACASSSPGTTGGKPEPTSGAETAGSPSPVPRERLVEMFRRMQEQARWDLSKDMLWGYFFISPKRAALARFRPVLEQQGYRFVEYVEPGDGDQNRLFYLHVERVETHSVDSLDERNAALAELAQQHGVEYDGMDVGPVRSAEHP